MMVNPDPLSRQDFWNVFKHVMQLEIVGRNNGAVLTDYETITDPNEVHDKEIVCEANIDGFFINKPKLVLNDWYEMFLQQSHHRLLRMVPPLRAYIIHEIFAPLEYMWKKVDALKLFYRGHELFGSWNIYITWAFSLRQVADSRKKEGEEGRYKYTELLVMYPYGRISNAKTEHLCLYPGHATYEIVNAASYFVSKVQAIYKKELHEELINFTYSPEHFFKWGLSHDFKFGGV